MTNVDGDTVIGVEAEPGRITILTDIKPDVADIRDLILAASLTGTRMDEIANGASERRRGARKRRSQRTSRRHSRRVRRLPARPTDRPAGGLGSGGYVQIE